MVISIAGRMLSQSARRGGYAVAVADLFNDRDTRACAARSVKVTGRDGGLGGFDSSSLTDAIAQLFPVAAECEGVVVGSGLESDLDLLERISVGRRLFANDPETVRKIKDPLWFFCALDEIGLPHPEVALTRPTDPTGWMAKSSGASGGAHVREATGADVGTGIYFQRFVRGTNYSLSFLANGREICVLGYNEPWTVALGDWPYCYGGAINRVTVPDNIRRDLEAKLVHLVARTRLRGLNGVDFIVTPAGQYSVIEVNPRPPGTLELYDPDVPRGLFHWHLRSFEGELPTCDSFGESIRAHGVVYTRRPFTLCAKFEFPRWCSDLPDPGTRFAARMPVCMVHAEGRTHREVKALVLARRQQIQLQLDTIAL